MRHLYAISDLHLGGAPDAPDAPGSQFCNAYPELAAFIDWIASPRSAPRGEVELVVNGDFIDYFAIDGDDGVRTWTADESEAIARFERAHSRARVVFDALARFVAAGHRLTLLIGNHDVELAMPKVRAHLLRLLGDRDRVRFIYDGEAYTVGRALFEHGNRYDRWNVIDHDRLREERSVASRGLPVDERARGTRFFQPPAGSHLVVRVMNRIKARYRFVDLLKPETQAVIPLLLALEPDHRVELDELFDAVSIGSKLLGHGLDAPATPASAGDLDTSSASSRLTVASALEEELGTDAVVFRDEIRRPTMSDGDLSVGDDIARAAQGLAATWGSLRETARSLSKVIDFIGERDHEQRRKKLLTALRHLNVTDASFDVTREAPDYLDAALAIASHGGFDLVVFGHTHLPKHISLALEGRTASYINSGAWVDVMRLPPEITNNDQDAAKEALEVFTTAIRRNDFAPYVRRYLSYVEAVVADDGRVLDAALRSFCGDEKPRAPALTDARDR